MLDTVSWVLPDGAAVREFSDGIATEAGKLRIIDQTRLPGILTYLELDDLDEIIDAIKRLAVRGAPAIGCAAALGLAAVCRRLPAGLPDDTFIEKMSEAAERLAASRPTAVNLTWALNRCVQATISAASSKPKQLRDQLLEEALNILAEDIRLCHAIGQHGAELIEPGMGILTHCNAGALATGDYGTALAPLYIAHGKGMNFTVFSDETRPLLQGARLTAWELSRAGIHVVTICDNMAAQVMKEGRIQLVLVGADRIAANGDAANKIGTYGLAVLASFHRIPCYVAAPYSTFDFSLDDGGAIPIEQRDETEIRHWFGTQTVPEAAAVYNPAFDVTPADLISGFITDRGIVRPPYLSKIRNLFKHGLRESENTNLPGSRPAWG